MRRASTRLAVLVLALVLATGVTAAGPRPQSISLIVAGSSPDPLALWREMGRSGLARAYNVRLFRSDDCLNMKPGLFFAGIGELSTAGSDRLSAVRRLVPSAYKRICQPKAGSLAHRSLNAADPSFQSVKADPINWISSDIVSRLNGNILIRPYFIDEKSSPTEGLHTAVDVIDRENQPVLLLKDCNDAQSASDADFAAVACATEQIADQPLFDLTVFRIADRSVLLRLRRCKAPTLVGKRTVRCRSQTVEAEGRISETLKVQNF